MSKLLDYACIWRTDCKSALAGVLKLISILIYLSFYSCTQDNIVVLKKNDDVLYKYHCKEGKDTLNSTVYKYYFSKIYSKSQLVNGQLNGLAYDYHQNGAVRIITHFQKGDAHGLNKVFAKNGTLLRQSIYIHNKQVLFESFMIDTIDNFRRRKITSISGKKEAFGGELISDSNGKILQGVYARINIPDTLTLEKSYNLDIDFTVGSSVKECKIVIGEFDRTLNCIDTSLYVQLKNLDKKHVYKYRPLNKGYNFIIGYILIPGYSLRIFFYDDFYVVENRSK